MTSYKPVLVGAAFGGVAGLTIGLLLKKPAAQIIPSGPPGPLPEPEPVEPPKVFDCPLEGSKVALIGDSFAEGLVPHMGSLARACGTLYIGDGRSGTSVMQWQYDSWIGPILHQKPTVVLISLAGNDFFKNPTDLKAAINKLVDRIRGTGARALWIEPNRLPMNEVSGVRQLWKDKMGNDWFPSWDLPYRKAEDNIHLFPSGYKAWAGEIWPWMSTKTHETIA